MNRYFPKNLFFFFGLVTLKDEYVRVSCSSVHTSRIQTGFVYDEKTSFVQGLHIILSLFVFYGV